MGRDSHNLLSGEGWLTGMNRWGQKDKSRQMCVTASQRLGGQGMKIQIKDQRHRNRAQKTAGPRQKHGLCTEYVRTSSQKDVGVEGEGKNKK